MNNTDLNSVFPLITNFFNKYILQCYTDFPGDTSSKEPPYPPISAGDVRDMSLVPESGRSPGGHGNPLQYSYLVNPMDREACRATVHGVA